MIGRILLAAAFALLTGAAIAQSPLEELERRLQSGELAPREPGWLGLIADDRETAGRGLRVTAVRPESPAEAAGIRVGDLLVEAERRRLRRLDDLSEILNSRTAGESVVIAFERDGRQNIVTVRLAERPAAPSIEELLPPPSVETAPDRESEPPRQSTGELPRPARPEPAPVDQDDFPPPSANEGLPPILPPSVLRPEVATSPRDEIESLRRESAELRRRLEQLERRLAELQEQIGPD